jgi:hypothetical protein
MREGRPCLKRCSAAARALRFEARIRELVEGLPDLAVLAGRRCSVAPQPVNIPVVGILWHGGSEKEEAYWFGLQRKSFADLGYITRRNIIFEDSLRI